MELVAFGQDVLQSIAEHAASYKLGQIALRQLDRALWVVEKCARWAVPPPLDQDDRPQPELVRPLPWVFFLMMLITLRITRESISIVNLIMGKPPLRSADVVMYIQSKRRYLRTLKYQGNRIARARTTNTQPRETWYSSVRSLFEFTMCFRKASQHYGNNNTTNFSNNDEVLVVKHGKPERESASPTPGANVESTMERLIEKMMVDVDAESDEDSCFTITTIATPKSERSESFVESDPETGFNNETSPTYTNKNSEPKEIKGSAEDKTPSKTPEKTELNAAEKKDNPETPQNVQITPQKSNENNSKEGSPKKNSETPTKDNTPQKIDDSKKESPEKNNDTPTKENTPLKDDDSKNESPKKNETPIKENETLLKQDETPIKENNTPTKEPKGLVSEQNIYAKDKVTMKNSEESNKPSTIPVKYNSDKKQLCSAEENALTWEKVTEMPSAKEDSMDFLQHERSQTKSPRTPKNDPKMANGRTMKSVPNKKKGGQTERREVNSAKSSPGM